MGRTLRKVPKTAKQRSGLNPMHTGTRCWRWEDDPRHAYSFVNTVFAGRPSCLKNTRKWHEKIMKTAVGRLFPQAWA